MGIITNKITREIASSIEAAVIEQIKKAQEENKQIMLKKMEELYSTIEEVIDQKVHDKCQMMMSIK